MAHFMHCCEEREGNSRWIVGGIIVFHAITYSHNAIELSLDSSTIEYEIRWQGVYAYTHVRANNSNMIVTQTQIQTTQRPHLGIIHSDPRNITDKYKYSSK